MVMSVMPDPQQHAALVYCCFAVFRFNKVYLKIGNLQSRKTKVPHSDWWFLSSTLCGWKDHFRNNSPFCTVSRSSQLLVYLLGLGLPCFSLFFCLFSKVFSNSERPCCFACFKAERWCQCPRPSVPPADMHLYSIIGACQWGSFLPVVYHISLNYGIPFFFTECKLLFANLHI